VMCSLSSVSCYLFPVSFFVMERTTSSILYFFMYCSSASCELSELILWKILE